MSDVVERLTDPRADVLGALVRSLELRDPNTARHSAAVARYARLLAEARGLGPAEIELAHAAGLLHDIGKFILPDRIISPTGAELTEADWDLIRRHPEEGANLLARIEGCVDISEIVLCHHERFDGNGYPCRLKGASIPILARIISIADTYDVMVARDTYCETISDGEAIVELRKVAGTQLDPELVEIFVGLVEAGRLHFEHHGNKDLEVELEPSRAGFGAVLAFA